MHSFVNAFANKVFCLPPPSLIHWIFIFSSFSSPFFSFFHLNHHQRQAGRQALLASSREMFPGDSTEEKFPSGAVWNVMPRARGIHFNLLPHRFLRPSQFRLLDCPGLRWVFLDWIFIAAACIKHSLSLSRLFLTSCRPMVALYQLSLHLLLSSEQRGKKVPVDKPIFRLHFSFDFDVLGFSKPRADFTPYLQRLYPVP